MAYHDLIGSAGVAFIVGMYLLLQSGRIQASNPHYSLWNAVGAALILVSLYFEFNFSALLIEAFWLAISLYGLVRAFRTA